jgi:hydrogenase accessory protein HypB
MEIDLSQPILAKNESLAADNRKLFDEKKVFVLDLLASPGAGKTSTILATIAALRDRYNIAVIEGDIASRVDAEKIKAHDIPAVQINTGGACHLESDMIKRAISVLDLDALDLIIVENVGNLVCPTEFDLGEHAKVMILSVPEGDDKPHKYPRHLPDRRGHHPQQVRHAARLRFRRGRVPRGRRQAERQGADLPDLGDEGRRRRGVGRVARVAHRRTQGRLRVVAVRVTPHADAL